MIHPVIRIVSFLVLAAFVAFGGFYQILAGFAVVLSVLLFRRLQSLELSLRIIMRMRWLFLSILVIYFWFTPGKPILSIAQHAMPTIQGVQMGVMRVLSLILIILALNFFVSAITRNRLVEAIIWLLNPLSRIGFDCRGLAIRIALVLELVPRVQQIVLDVRQNYDNKTSSSPDNGRLKWYQNLASRIAIISQLVERLFERVVEEALKMPSETISFTIISRPPMLQWLLPIAFALMFTWVKHI